MKRKLNALELRRLKEGGQQPTESQNAGPPCKISRRTPKVGKRSRGLARQLDPREHEDLSREEIALMLMEISEKKERCFDFDLHKWLDRYEKLQNGETNFPEAAMMIVSAAHIFGRKVDYLEDIILHMDQDQKGRDDGTEEKEKEGKQTGRKRNRFQPESLSDCFSDLEFSFVDKKTAPIGSLVNEVQRICVDSRSKFQQMQELCSELRTMPTKQRRLEILTRLKDDANIAPIMSSHTLARKNQILDIESGETIGTRYDYQIHLNFIDVRTGSLIPEHNLKKFFQRCDVIDYLFEQQECDGPGEGNVFPLKPREFKMYIPPDYLRNKYQIQVGDTSDFDNELHKARASNFRIDPMLELMKSRFADQGPANVELETSIGEISFSNVLASSRIEQNDSVTEQQDTGLEDACDAEIDSTPLPESENLNATEEGTSADANNSSQETNLSASNLPSEDIPSNESAAVDGNASENPCEAAPDPAPPPSRVDCTEVNHPSREQSTEPELVALEKSSQNHTTAVDEPQQPCNSRLSLEDEGIGADRESVGKCSSLDMMRTPSLEKLSDGIGSPLPPKDSQPFFNGGTVIAPGLMSIGSRTITLKPALVKINMLRIPESMLRKHLLFTLPLEYKKMKMDTVRKKTSRGKDLFTLTVYSLSPTVSKDPARARRPSTPEPEDFHGFDELEEILNGPFSKSLYSLAPISEGQQSNMSRASTPENDFLGFESVEESYCRKPSQTKVCQAKTLIETPQARILIQAIDHQDAEPALSKNADNDSVENSEEQPPEANGDGSNEVQSKSQHTTPSRTLSRDSGISDDQNDRRGSRSKEASPEPFSQSEGQLQPEDSAPQEDDAPDEDAIDSTVTSARYIQSVAEAKEMMQKVNNWHRKLKPILVQSEKRNHFDIHAYGTEIIDSFGPPDQDKAAPTTNFARVMCSKQEDYTARYFLSMLMLANTNNVQIITRNQDALRLTEKEDIELRLLSRKRHHQEMESMGERIPCDNTPSGKALAKVRRASMFRGKKRKRLIEDDEGLADDEIVEISGVGRLAEKEDDADHTFLEKLRQMYPDINSEETVRKRIAFHRGMRRCAYGLSSDKVPDKDTASQELNLASPAAALPTSADIDETEEILSVDLETNEAVLRPVMIDPDPCCSKSIISMAESGYESMIASSVS